MSLDKHRQRVILDTLEETGRVRVGQLAERLAVSPMTIRRDLTDLENAGLLVRVHGGAVLTEPGEARPETDRAAHNIAGKRRIAAVVAEMIPSGSRVILESGTTVAEVALLLRGRQLEVLTASLTAASILGDDPSTRLTVVGGRVRAKTMTVMGPDTDEAIAAFHADFGVLSAAGLAEDAFFIPYPGDVLAQRALLQASAVSLLVADHAKMGISEGVRVADLAALSAIVTDREIDTPIGKNLPQVIVAGAAGPTAPRPAERLSASRTSS